jgi:hypothetical protein
MNTIFKEVMDEVDKKKYRQYMWYLHDYFKINV